MRVDTVRASVAEPPFDHARPSQLSPLYDPQALDELVQSFSRISVAVKQREDAVSRIVREILLPTLSAFEDGECKKLLPDHPCFELSRQFANKWNISDTAVQNHIKLACGYLKFPVILLLNPAPTHEKKSFDRMVEECKTLKWIENVLKSIGIELADVMILDACTLLGSDKLNQLGAEGRGRKEQAISEAYDLTQKMLQMIKPDIIVSCQCSTSFSKWLAGGHFIARELCSSIKRAKEKQVKQVTIGDHTINVVQAYHPSGFLNHNKDSRHHDPRGELLEGLFEKLFLPCLSRKRRLLVSTVSDAFSSTSTYASAKSPVKERNLAG